MKPREYLKENKISILSISKNAGIPYTTVNDIINGRTDINNVALGTVRKLALALSMTMDGFLDLFADSGARYEVPGGWYEIYAQGKKYYIRYEYKGKQGASYVCKASKVNDIFIPDLAKWEMRSIMNREDMENWDWTGR